jgi:uncharacterized protein (DUF433 family)
MKMLEDLVGSGSGLYTLREAARYARMQPITLTRWFKGDDYCKRVLRVEDSKIITFLDFVQALAIHDLRAFYHIPLKHIREAADRAFNEFGIAHPFAYKHTTYLFDGKLWIQPEGIPLIQIAGRERGQIGLTPIIENFSKDVAFDPETSFAMSYKAFERAYASGTHKITMNPKLRFGEPLLDDVGYTPEALFEAAKIEGREATAKNYGVTEDQVQICIDYFDHLSPSSN